MNTTPQDCVDVLKSLMRNEHVYSGADEVAALQFAIDLIHPQAASSTQGIPQSLRDLWQVDHDLVDEIREIVGLKDRSGNLIERVRDLVASTPQPQGDGWQRMTDEAKAIQRRHLDNHQGDVYHAMQHLATRYGCPDTRPMTQPATRAPGASSTGLGEAVVYITRECLEQAKSPYRTIPVVSAGSPLKGDNWIPLYASPPPGASRAVDEAMLVRALRSRHGGSKWTTDQRRDMRRALIAALTDAQGERGVGNV